MKNGGFPRLAPESLVISMILDRFLFINSSLDLTDLEGLLRGGDNDEDMQADEDIQADEDMQADSIVIEVKVKKSDQQLEKLDEDGDIEMDEFTEDLDVKQATKKDDVVAKLADSSSHDPFPPIPLELEDNEFLDNECSRKEEEGYEDDIYYFTQQLEGSMDSFLNLKLDDNSIPTMNNGNLLNTQDVNSLPNQQANENISLSMPIKPSMDTLLGRAIESHILHHSYNDIKRSYPLISHKFILTLLAFRSGQHLGVSIADGNGGGSSGYETKSILSDLLLLRTPAIPSLYGGNEELEPDGRLASEVYQMPRTRKKEKARDSGQGKAPVKTAQQKAERKKMMEEAAARKKQALAEAAVRREVKYLAKLERAESKGIKLDPASLARKDELKKRVGGIVITRKETKRDKAKREKIEAEAAAKAASAKSGGSTLKTGEMALASAPSFYTTGTVSSVANSPTLAKEDDLFSDDDDDELPPFPLPNSPLPQKRPLDSVSKDVASSSIKLNLKTSNSPRKVVLKLPSKSMISKPLTTESIKSLKDRIMCICSDSNIDFGLTMVSCERCYIWFHGSCMGWNDSSIGEFICPRCKK
jgi:hypothetical protein